MRVIPDNTVSKETLVAIYTAPLIERLHHSAAKQLREKSI